MSHVATVEIEIKNLDDLAKACERIGCELVRGKTSYKWFGEHVGDYPVPEGFSVADLGKCEHAIRVRGNHQAYEIGVVRRRDGQPGWVLHWDFFEGGYGLENVVGQGCNKLKQSYAVVSAMRTARGQGFAVEEQRQADGRIKLVCRK